MATTDFADCQTIIRAFEKGCAYSTDERSVFALATPLLQDSMMMSDASQRLAAEAYGRHIANIDDEISDELGNLQERINTEQEKSLPQISEAQENAADFVDQPQGLDGADTAGVNLASFGVANAVGGAANNSAKAKLLQHTRECLPCDLRIIGEQIKNYDWGKAGSAVDEMRDVLEEYWKSIMERFMDLINMFKDVGTYVDICAFVKWMKDFVCVPDLYKIVAALSAMLMDICKFMDGFGIDLVLSLVAPLMMPSLQALVSVLTDFLLLILKPIECIIDAIEKVMRKLDVTQFRLPSDITLRLPKWVAKGGSDYWTSDATRNPQQEHNLGIAGQFSYPKSASLKETGTWKFDKGIEFSIKDDYARDASVYHKHELPDTQTYLKYAQEGTKWVGRLNKHIRTMFGDLVYFLHAAVGRFEKMVRSVLDELTKLIQEYVLGYSYNTQRAAAQKLAILQLLKVVSFFINLFSAPECEEEDGTDMNASYITRALSTAQGYMAYQDENGDIRIEEPDEAVRPAREVLGTVVEQDVLRQPISAEDLQQTVFATADPVLNAKLADIVEKITTPVKVVFGCSFDISATDVDQYNEWMLGE